MVIDWSEGTPAQQAAAFTALKAHSAAQAGHPANKHDSVEYIISNVLSGVQPACFIAGYFLLYEHGPSWSTAQSLLYELMVLRATPEGTFDDYIAGLRELAAQHACYGIMTGNSVLRPGLRRLYNEAGFIKCSECYFMEV